MIFLCALGGTYWMHSHYGFQEQLLLSAPLIIRDGGEEPGRAGGRPHAHRLQLHAAGADLWRSCSRARPMRWTMDTPGMAMAAMMSKPDLNDVQYDAFLANAPHTRRSGGHQGRARRPRAAADHQCAHR